MPAGRLAGLFFFFFWHWRQEDGFLRMGTTSSGPFGSMMHSRMPDESYHTVAAGSRTCVSKFHLGKITCASKNKGSLSLC
jgi:hypothetical protein